MWPCLRIGPESVRKFGCWTAALDEMAEWLKSCRIDTVAMQATGVYWIALYDVLEQHGIPGEDYGPGGLHVNPEWKRQVVGFATREIGKLQRDMGTNFDVIIDSGNVASVLQPAAHMYAPQRTASVQHDRLRLIRNRQLHPVEI